jgi:hypothetical protein
MERAALPLNQALAYGVQAHGAGGAAAAPPTCFLYRLSLFPQLYFRFVFVPSANRLLPRLTGSPNPIPRGRMQDHRRHSSQNPFSASQSQLAS